MATRDRDPLLRHIATTLGGPLEGSFVVIGEPGIGKSHLLALAGRLSPIPVVEVHVNPAEQMWPLSGLSAVFAALDPRAVEFAGRFTLRSMDPMSLQAAAADILALVRGLRLSPTAVLVDDIDLMDDVSRALLGYMAGRLGGSGLRIVASATRLGPRDPLSGSPRERITRMGDDAALEIACGAGVDGLDFGTARILVEQAGGNPAVLLAAVTRLSDEQRAGRDVLRFPLRPIRAANLVARDALEGLSPSSRAVVDVLSLAPLTRSDALAAAGLATPDELDDLARAGVLEEVDPYVRVRDPLVRASVFHAIPGGDRREWHQELAAAHAPLSPGLAAWHASFTLADGPFGVDLMRAAITHAGEGRVVVAVEFADRALSRRADPPSATDTLTFIRDLHERGLWAIASRYLALAARDEMPDDIRSEHAFARISIDLERTGRIPVAMIEATVERHAAAAPAAAASLLASTAMHHAFRGDLAHATGALEQAEALGGRAGGSVGRLFEAVTDVVEAAAGADEESGAFLPEDALVASPAELVVRAWAASLREDYPGATRLCSLVLESTARPTTAFRRLARMLLVENAIRAGRFDDAQREFSHLRDGGRPDAYRARCEILAAWVDAAADRVPAARSRLEEWLDESHDAAALEIASAHALLGELALMDGDGEGAARQLSLAEVSTPGGIGPGTLRMHPTLIDALVATDRQAAARAVFLRFEAACGRVGGRWASLAVPGCRSLFVPPEQGIALLDRTISAFGPDDSGWERARLIARKAGLLRRSGVAEADDTLLQAQAGFELAGAHGWARRLVVAPRQPHEHRLLEMLSPSERDVARLVRLGYHNKEIASRLFVSLRTVELRLTQIYRKTGVPSRTHLVAALT